MSKHRKLFEHKEPKVTDITAALDKVYDRPECCGKDQVCCECRDTEKAYKLATAKKYADDEARGYHPDPEVEESNEKQCSGCYACAEIADDRNNSVAHDCGFKAKLESLKRELEDQAVAKKEVDLTNRRIIVEEIKSTAESGNGTIGESDTISVRYEYGIDREHPEFRENIRPTRVTIDVNNSFLSSSRGDSFTRLQLQAHIKNLQAVLNTLV